MTPSQIAAGVVLCNEWAKAGTKQEIVRTGEPGSPVPAATVKEMAEQAGVSERTIQRAKTAIEAGLAEEVKAGKQR